MFNGEYSFVSNLNFWSFYHNIISLTETFFKNEN